MMMALYLTRIAAGAYLLDEHGRRRSPKYLAKLAMTGGGLAFYKAYQAAFLHPNDLDSWANETIGPSAPTTLEHRLPKMARAT